MILTGVLLVFVVSALTGMALDLRLILMLRQQRAAAIAMPTLRRILDHPHPSKLERENAVLNQRLNHLEEKLQLLESIPTIDSSSSPAREPVDMRVSGGNHGSRDRDNSSEHGANVRSTTDGDAQARARNASHCDRVEITPEEIAFLTGGGLGPAEQRVISSPPKDDVVLKRFEAYFPANGDLLQHADEVRDFLTFARTAILRAIRMEGFGIQSESLAEEFLAKLAANYSFPLAVDTSGIRSFLARELIAYLAGHPRKQVRGRGVLSEDPPPRPSRR